MREAACSRRSAVDGCRYRARRPWTLSCSYQISVARAFEMPRPSPSRRTTNPWGARDAALPMGGQDLASAVTSPSGSCLRDVHADIPCR